MNKIFLKTAKNDRRLQNTLYTMMIDCTIIMYYLFHDNIQEFFIFLNTFYQFFKFFKNV